MSLALSEICYWPSLVKDVHKYCATCDSCASSKPPNHSPLGPVQLVAIPDLPWVSVQWVTTSSDPSPCPVEERTRDVCGICGMADTLSLVKILANFASRIFSRDEF
eukprot:3361678-Rhodomonas_salina.1